MLWDFIKDKMLNHPFQHISENKANITYEEIIIWADTFADNLRGAKCCAILCSSELATAMSLLACFAANVTAVPLSLRYGKKHCNNILDAIDPDTIMMDTNGTISVYRIKDSKYVVPKVHPSLIMCTSGTTGKPKGAMLTEWNIITNVSDITEYFGIDSTDTILIARPLYHCAVLTGEFLVALVKGSNIRFHSHAFNPIKILDLIDKYKVTAFCGTPTLLSIIAKFKRTTEVETLRHICVSGECMSSEVGLNIKASFPKCNIYHVYGLTEACPRVSYLPPDRFSDYPDCVGIPLNSVSIKLINHNGKPCSKNEEGILYVKGDNIMLGYYCDPQKTHDVIKNGWLCTGDVALINDAGFLKIIGRNDDLIIRSGMNIYPAEIEGVIKKDPRVKEVLVYGYNNQAGTQIGMKLVGDFSTTEEIKSLCMNVLPPFQVPTKIELVDELPKNGSGKIIRSKNTHA